MLEPLLVHADGPWLRDAKGRVVLLRGANVVWSDDAQNRLTVTPGTWKSIPDSSEALRATL